MPAVTHHSQKTNQQILKNGYFMPGVEIKGSGIPY